MSNNEPRHLAVWLDHKIARLLTLSSQPATERIVRNDDAGAHGHVHHHSGTLADGHSGMDKTFLEKISGAIGEAQEIVVLGPVEARNGLKSFLEHHNPNQARRIIAMAAKADAGTADLAAFAKRLFYRFDRMKAPSP